MRMKLVLTALPAVTVLDGKPRLAHRVACREPHGSWRIEC